MNEENDSGATPQRSDKPEPVAVDQLSHAVETLKRSINNSIANRWQGYPHSPVFQSEIDALIAAVCADSSAEPTCEQCGERLTCDPEMREALAGEKHLNADLMDRTERAEDALREIAEGSYDQTYCVLAARKALSRTR